MCCAWTLGSELSASSAACWLTAPASAVILCVLGQKAAIKQFTGLFSSALQVNEMGRGR